MLPSGGGLVDEPETVVTTMAELFPAARSDSSAWTTAESVIVPRVGGEQTIVTVAAEPGLSVPRWATTVVTSELPTSLMDASAVPWLVETEVTEAIPNVSELVINTLVASSELRFVTVIVYVRGLPTVAGRSVVHGAGAANVTPANARSAGS